MTQSQCHHVFAQASQSNMKHVYLGLSWLVFEIIIIDAICCFFLMHGNHLGSCGWMPFIISIMKSWSPIEGVLSMMILLYCLEISKRKGQFVLNLVVCYPTCCALVTIYVVVLLLWQPIQKFQSLPTTSPKHHLSEQVPQCPRTWMR